MTRFLAVLVLAAACGGGAAKSTTTMPAEKTEPGDQIPQTGGPDCAVVADKLAIVALADKPDEQAGMRDHVRLRCTRDTWSDEARNCFATVENDAEIEGCKQKLTNAQRAQIGGPHAHDAPGGGAPAAKPAEMNAPAKPTPKSSTRGVKPKDSSDPCEGGE